MGLVKVKQWLKYDLNSEMDAPEIALFKPRVWV
jgi:hypothetical protein